MNQKYNIALYIDPPSHHFLGDRLFELFDGRFQSSLAQCYAYLRDVFTSEGIPVRTADYIPNQPGDTRNIYVSTGMLINYRKLSKRPDTALSAFFVTESPIVEPSLYRELNKAQHYFKRVYSWSDSSTVERFVGGPLRCKPFRWPMAFDKVHETIWGNQNNRKFLVMININKLPRIFWQELYTERMRAVEFFSRTGEIDLYGVNWDGPPYRVGKTWMPYTLQRIHRTLLHNWQHFHPDPLLEAARRVYKGSVRDKYEVLGRYNFSICFENVVMKGWITEKIFDCFYTGAIPVYWGAPDIQDHIPPECFIDMRQFKDYSELRGYLKSLGEKEILKYKENGREYLNSPQFYPFTKHAFVDIFRQIIEEDTGVKL